MSDFPGDETFAEETGEGYPADDPLGLEGDPNEVPPADPAEPDPFAEVPPVAAADGDDLPPNVVPGTLGGESPSEMEPIDPESEPPYDPDAAVAPGPGDVADDDPEAPLAPEDVGLGDEPPPVAPEPEPDPLAEDQSRTADPPPTAGGQDNGQLESEQKEPPVEPNSDAPKPAPKPRKRRARKGAKLQPGQREYTVLKAWAAKDDEHGPLWEEALDAPVIARSGELALRKAFRLLAENKPGAYELVPVPTKYWNPEPVQGEVPDAALAIKVGGKKK